MFTDFTTQAQVASLINPVNLGDWRPAITVGVPGGIPTDRTNLINVTLPPYNADKTGGVDASSAINAAINAAPSNSVVYLPSGKYLLAQGLGSKAYVTIRGAGMTNTILKCLAGGISVERYTSGYNNASGYPVATAGLTKGSTNISVNTTGSYPYGFAADRVVQITRFNSTNQYEIPLVWGPGGTNGGYGWQYKSMHRVVAKTPSSITIWPPLQGDMSGMPVRVVPSITSEAGISPLRRMGVEDLTLDMNGGTGQTGVQWYEVEESWVKGVRILSPLNRGIHFLSCLQMEIRDCFIDLNRDNGNNGAGMLIHGCSFSLVENNIVIRAFPGIQHNAGVGSVFGYNFLMNTNGFNELTSNHGAHSAYNLWEGNIAGRFLSDGYHGSASHDTVFRNWLHGTIGTNVGTQLGYVLGLKRFTRNYQIVGNIFGRPAPYTMVYDGTSYGQPNLGNGSSSGFAPPWAQWGQQGLTPNEWQELDTNVLATTTRRGNYDYFTRSIPASQSLGTAVLPDSLYLSGRPVWFGTVAWPPVNPLAPSVNFTNIPAGYRYETGASTPGLGTADITPPTAAASLAAVATSPSAVSVSWPAATDNVGVTGYRVERSQGAGSTTFAQIATPTGTSLADTALTPATVYNYRVRATDAAGNLGSYSTTATATTGATAVNQPPAVNLTTPLSGASAYAPTAVTLNATVSDTDGTVTKVEFFEGLNKLGEDTSAPYSLVWNVGTAGTFVLTAVAHDNSGAATLSASALFTSVQPGITSAQRLPNGSFNIVAAGTAGRTNTVHVSSDLATWTLLTNLVNDAGTVNLVDAEAAILSRRFYRIWAESLFLSNVVGFARVSVPPGYSIIANQFIQPTNTVAAVLTGVPGGTSLSKFRPATGDFSINNYDPIFLSWLDPNQSFTNGDTGFLLNPTTNAFTLTFQGRVPQGLLSHGLPAGYSMVGSLVPQTGTIQNQLGFPGASGDTVFLYRDGRYRTSQFDPLLGGWDFEPNVNVGEGFFLFKSVATNWTRSFSAFN